MMKLSAQCRIDTPLGPLCAARSPQGLAGLWFDAQAHHPGPLDAPQRADDPLLQAAARLLERYFQGQVLPQALDELPLDPQGSAFQQQVWQALRAIPSGHSRSYGQLAAQLGRPQAARAVGAAVGRNPISILIPCHRVLGVGGQLTGYAGGLARKQALLRLEGAAFAGP